MTTHLIHIPIDLRALYAWGEARGLSCRGVFDEGLALHHLLGESFGPAVLQPFRLMVSRGARTGALYAYAAQTHEELAVAAAQTFDPAMASVIDLADLRSHPRPAAAWSAGQRLGFDLRIRPVVRLAKPLQMGGEAFRKGAELDAYLPYVARAPQEARLSREEVYLDWLAKRLEGAVDIERSQTVIARCERSMIIRNGRRIEGPDVIIQGTFSIVDPTAYAQLLARGIGRHRTYGYGMMMLRPPQKVSKPQSMESHS